MSSMAPFHQDAEKFQELVAFAQESMEQFRVPGIALGLWLNGQEYVAGLGRICIDKPDPVTAETVFVIASITKTVTTTGIFRLVEQGKISLDDPVRNYIPNFQVRDEEASAKATIRHLLNHTAGWMGDFFINTGEDDEALARFVEKMTDVPQLTPFGSFYTYNNASFNIAGRVLEIAMGKPYEIAIRELVLDPLKMANSFFYPSEIGNHQMAAGHYQRGEELKVASPWVVSRGEAPCGGLVSTVSDLIRYARFHMGDGLSLDSERLLTRESIRQMQNPSIPTEEDSWMGLNWFIRDIEGVRTISHSGDSDGQNSVLWMAPEKKLAFTALTNLDPGVFLCEKLTKWVQEQYLGLVMPEPIVQVLSEQQLDPYIGCYQIQPGNARYSASLDNGYLSLTLTAGDDIQADDSTLSLDPPVRLSSYALDRFVLLNGPKKGHKMDFLRDNHGRVRWLRIDGRVAIKDET